MVQEPHDEPQESDTVARAFSDIWSTRNTRSAHYWITLPWSYTVNWLNFPADKKVQYT